MLKTTSKSVKVQFSLGSVFDLLFLLQFLLSFLLDFLKDPVQPAQYICDYGNTHSNFTNSNQQFTKLTKTQI